MIGRSLISTVLYVKREPPVFGYFLLVRIRYHFHFKYYQVLAKMSHVEDSSCVGLGGEVK